MSNTTKKRSLGSKARRVVAKSPGRKTTKVKFGDVVVVGERPSAAAVKQSVEFSTAALERLGVALAKPGITLRPRKDVPLYSAAGGDPGVLIRRLNGRTERVRFVDGVFEVIV